MVNTGELPHRKVSCESRYFALGRSGLDGHEFALAALSFVDHLAITAAQARANLLIVRCCVSRRVRSDQEFAKTYTAPEVLEILIRQRSRGEPGGIVRPRWPPRPARGGRPVRPVTPRRARGSSSRCGAECRPDSELPRGSSVREASAPGMLRALASAQHRPANAPPARAR